MGHRETADPKRQTAPPEEGALARYNMREVLNTLFYLNRSGCQWDMLPHDLLPKSTVYDYFAQWRDDGTWAKIVQALRERTRVAAGRQPTPSAVCIDSQSVKTTEMGGPERGYDGGKKINGRKRHLLVDTLGLLRPFSLPVRVLMMGWQHRSCSGTSTHTTFRVSSRSLRITSITITPWTPGWLRIVQAGISKCRHGQPARKAYTLEETLGDSADERLA